MKVKIVNPAEEVETAHETLEAFINERFGSSYEAFKERGGKVTEVKDKKHDDSDKKAEADGPNYSAADQQVIKEEAAAEAAYKKKS